MDTDEHKSNPGIFLKEAAEETEGFFNHEWTLMYTDHTELIGLGVVDHETHETHERSILSQRPQSTIGVHGERLGGWARKVRIRLLIEQLTTDHTDMHGCGRRILQPKTQTSEPKTWIDGPPLPSFPRLPSSRHLPLSPCPPAGLCDLCVKNPNSESDGCFALLSMTELGATKAEGEKLKG